MTTNIKIIRTLLNKYHWSTSPLKNYSRFRFNILLSFIVLLFFSDLSYAQNSNCYIGIAQNEIKCYKYDVFKKEYYLDYTKNVSYEAIVYTSEPLISTDGLKESNPFSIYIGDLNNSTLPVEGTLNIYSAALYLSEDRPGNVMLQYWKINMEGNSFTGKLTDRHGGIGPNLMYGMDELIQMIFPFEINVNSIMSGTITNDSINIKMEGQCSDKFLFSADIKAANKKVANEPTFALQGVLDQNYPNPFHSSTRISFELPKTSNVILSVYNLNGERVAELIKRKMEAGRHFVSWDVNNQQLSSGTYLIKMETDHFVQTRKCNFIK